jgi:hypothetical protein
MLNLCNLGGHLEVEDCYDVYNARIAKGWIYDAGDITNVTAKGWIYDAGDITNVTTKGWIYDARDITSFTAKIFIYDTRGTAHFTKGGRDNQHRFVAHMILHDLIEAEDVRGCFDERAS